jgi:hypothetical protein
MAVFRVERNKGYTVMSNHHLRNKDLPLKAKGLLSQMLSLPEDWDYTLKGLSLINREQIDAIRAAIRELEQAGYIVRSRERDSQGRLRGADYVIYEQPQPVPDSPTLENPMLDNPTQEKPTLGKPTQLNKDISSKEKSITDVSITDPIPILSRPSPLEDEAAQPPERKGTEAKSQSAIEIYRQIITNNKQMTFNHFVCSISCTGSRLHLCSFYNVVKSIAVFTHDNQRRKLVNNRFYICPGNRSTSLNILDYAYEPNRILKFGLFF